LNADQLATYLTDKAKLEIELGFPILKGFHNPNVQHAIGMKLEKMRQAPVNEHPWITYWLIILREIKCGGGLVGFKGSPNEKGEVIIGYGIDPSLEGNGYMTEAVKTIGAWALAQPGCNTIIADVDKTNLASIRVQQKVGARLDHEDQQKVYYVMEIK
jgi:RimJ/RimL family protein N-acetyltransferase